MDEVEDLAPLWEAAIASYEKETKHELSPELLAALRGVDSTEELIRRIEASGQAFTDFRHKKSKVWGTLRRFVAPLAAVLQIALTPASVGNGFGIPASAAIGACLYLVKSCENVSQAYDWIEEVLTELQEFTERLNEYAKSEIGVVLQKKIVAILSFILKVIGRSEALIKEHRFRLYLHVTFLGKDEKTKQLVEDLNKLFGSEQRFILAVTYATVKRTDSTLNRLEAKVDEMKEVQATMKEHADREESVMTDKRIRELLRGTSAADDVEETYVRNKRSLLKGTGGWLQHESLFESWMEQDATLLWIFGLPGAGKSFLSTWLVSKLSDSRQQKHQAACVAYFFVKENNQILRDANNILKTLAWQLTGQDTRFKQHVTEVSKHRALTITAEDTWESIFLGYYDNVDADPKFASIVIDGLDEATAATRRTLLGFMKELVSASRSSRRPMIQFAVIGRTSLRDDVKFARQEKIYFIEVSREKNRGDMDSYVCKRLEEVDVLREMRKMKPGGLKRANKTGAAIRTKILDSADGVFLWAKLLIETILHKDLPQIESILREPPGDLDDMIWSVFDRLARDEELNHEFIKKMLLFCGYARTPLKVGELDLFLSLPSGKPNLLLWKHLRGKLSSVFELKFPQGFNPDEVEITETQEKDDQSGEATVEKDNIDSDAGGFDFGGDIDDDEDSDEVKTIAGDEDDDDIFNPQVDRSLQSEQNLDLVKTESIRHMSDGQLNTHIAFCHSRIKDYIVREGSSWRQKPYCIIIPVADEAELQLTLVCLDVLRLELSLKNDSKYLADYVLRNLAQHLQETKRTTASDNDFRRVIEGLHWLFGTEKGAKSFVRPAFDYGWQEFYYLWIGKKKHLKRVQEWLREVETRSGVQSALSPAAREWAHSAANSFQNLLTKWMTAISSFWLVRPSYDSDEYLWKGESAGSVLDGCLSLIENSSAKDHTDIESASRIELLARWAGFQRDTHWHSSVGWMMLSKGFYDETIHHCKEACALDSQAWVAMEGAARAYGDKQPPEYALAIEWQTRALNTIPERMKWVKCWLWPRITTWNAALGNEEMAFDAALQGWNTDYISNKEVRHQYLKALYRKGDLSGFVWSMKWLNEQHFDDNDGMNQSRLVEFFAAGFDLYYETGKAFRQEGQPAWLVDALEQTLKLIDQREWFWIKVWFPLKMAKLGLTFYDSHQDRFIKAAETFLEQHDRQSSSFQEGFTDDRKWIVNKLAQLYFDIATKGYKEAGEITLEVRVVADKLKVLAVSVGTSFESTYDGFDFFREDYPSLLWGRWLRDYKKVEDKVWRKCFKVRLLTEMDALDDNDPANDTCGISSLAISLFHAGDRRDAAGMLAVLFKAIEEKKAAKEIDDQVQTLSSKLSSTTTALEEVSTSEDMTPEASNLNEIESQKFEKIGTPPDSPTDESKPESLSPETAPNASTVNLGSTTADQETMLYLDEFSGYYQCDNCVRDVMQTAEMYFCEICLDVNWCGECLVKLQDASLRSSLNVHICDPTHDFYRAYPIPDEARNLAVEYLEAGVQLRKEWLANLREEWMKAGI